MFTKSTNVISYLYEIYPKKVIQVIFLQVIAGLLEAFSLISLFPLFVILTKGEFTPDGLFENLVYDLFSFLNIKFDVLIILLLSIIIVFIKGFLSYFIGKTVGYTAAYVGKILRSRLYRSIIFSQWPFIIEQKVGELNTSMTNESTRAAMSFTYFNHFISGIILIIIYIVLAIIFSPLASTLGICSSLLFYLTINKTLKTTKKSGKQITLLLKNIGNKFVESLNGLKAIKAMGQELTPVKELDTYNKKFENAQRVRISNKWFLKSLNEPFTFSFIALIFFILYSFHQTKIEYILILMLICSRILAKINVILSNYQSILATESAFDSMYDIINRANAKREEKNGRHNIKIIKQIKFKNVSLKYGKTLIIKKADFEIFEGEFITLKGLSGSGKTTIVDSIVGLSKISKGNIFFNSTNINQINLSIFRKKIGFVPQDVFLFNGTLEENITMHSKPNEKLIQRVIKTSESTNFINKLKYGLKTNVGEKGQKFSGGERQRISLMRALYQCPNILILDEFSSAIDKETSLKIYKNLRSIKSDKIIISISHDKNIETFVDKTFLIKDKAVRIQNG